MVVVRGPAPDLWAVEQPFGLQSPDVAAREPRVPRELVDRELSVGRLGVRVVHHGSGAYLRRHQGGLLQNPL